MSNLVSNKLEIERLLVIASALHDAGFDDFGDGLADIANQLQTRESTPSIPLYMYETEHRYDLGMETRVFERIGDRKTVIYTRLHSDKRPHPPIPCDVKIVVQHYTMTATLYILLDGTPVHTINGMNEQASEAIYENQKRLVMHKQITRSKA